MKEKEKIMTECCDCINKRVVPGNCHIQCVNPDLDMTGDPHGIKKGWFMYPLLFDPTWKTKACSNHKLSPVVSNAVSQETQEHTS